MIIRVNQRKYDTDKLTYEELQALTLEIDESIASIKEQLRVAAAKRYETGKWADPEWFNAATRAQKALQRSRQQVQVLIGLKSRQLRRQTKSMADFFFDVAREYMDTKDFERILYVAKKRRDSEISEIEG